MSKPRHPAIEVQLTGVDGNAFNVLGVMRRALIAHGVPAGEVAEFLTEATEADYDHLLATCMRWVTVR